MTSDRRRSSRLIASPWLYNWTKKKPEYVTIDDDGSSGKYPGIVSGGSLLRKKVSGSVVGKGPGEVTTPLPRLDIRRERMEADEMRRSAADEEDDEFMTPEERFGSSGKKTAGLDVGKDGCSRLSAKSRVSTASIVKRLRIKTLQNSSDGRDVSGLSKPEMPRVGSSSSKMPEARRRAARCIANRARLGVRVTPPKRDQEKKKRNYAGYLQKKFTPSIITNVMLKLSSAQKEWVKKAGFGALLGFRMQTYQHRLGYKIVDAFCNRTCKLRLKAGDVVITEKLVHKIIGLPLGDVEIELTEGKIGKTDWDKQYSGKSISPIMVMNEIQNSRRADNNFKMNFLVLVYNFFIEANQNRWISRKMVSFKGNLDECGQYNWCKLLIAKLRKTHAYWEQQKWRNFAGPLVFLIYCYATCLRSNHLVHKNIIMPAYLSWTDEILREREKNETDDDKFGVGSLVLLEDDIQDVDMHMGSRGLGNTEYEDISRELSMREMIVPDSVSGDSEENFVGGFEGMDVDKDSDGENRSELLRGEELTGCEMQNDGTHEQVIQQDTAGEERQEVVADKGNTVSSGVANAGQGNIEHMVVDGKDSGLHESPAGGQNTQSRADIEIEKHFEEEPYMKRFEANLEDLEAAYNRCVTNFIDSMALYPHNAKLAELKKRYKVFFQLFGESSPITKSLSSLCANQGPSTNVDVEQDTCVPSFSLGLSQMNPTNLGDAMEKCVVSPAAAVPLGKKASGSSDRETLPEPVKARPRRDIIPSAICRSPYVTRVTDINRHSLTAEEKDVWEWLCEDKTTQADYIFEWNGRRCTKAHFHSLEENKQVESTVIDTWTHMLNENEIYRAESSPLRMFLTSETIYGPMLMNVQPGDTDARLNRYEAFDDNMEVVLELVNKIHNRTFNISEFELFLFPVYTGSHHYIICYNIKKPRWEIIDNLVQEMSFDDTYGDLPWKLHDCFCQFLTCYSVPRLQDIRNLRPASITMSWQTMDNTVDCGVFVMRHLECYMGNASGWSTGLRCERDNQKNVLQKLRAIYLQRILLWSKNRKRHLVLQKMVNYSKQKLLGD